MKKSDTSNTALGTTTPPDDEVYVKAKWGKSVLEGSYKEWKQRQVRQEIQRLLDSLCGR